jgi:hypothetical protein
VNFMSIAKEISVVAWPTVSAMLMLLAANAVGTTACASDSSARREDLRREDQSSMTMPAPRYRHLAPPLCNDQRDESVEHACWRVSPATGSRFVTVSASGGITDLGAVECWKSRLAQVPQDAFHVIDDDGVNACAARNSGGIACWGWAPWPAVPGSPKFVAVTVGGSGIGEDDTGGINACGLPERGDIVCWGDGTRHWSGRLYLPGPFIDMDLGGGLVVALRPGGRLEFYSKRDRTDLSWAIQSGPHRTLSQHGNVMCQVQAGGRVACQGGFLRGALPPADLKDIRLIRTGSDHACALEDRGAVRCWGDHRPPPVLRFRYISQPDFWDSYCGITVDEEAYCWGEPSPNPPLL